MHIIIELDGEIEVEETLYDTGKERVSKDNVGFE